MYQADSQRYEKSIYGYCGRSGLKLPRISLGLWHNFGTFDNFETMREIILTAFDHGITHLDAANNYGPEPGSAEQNLGKILHRDLSQYRDELLISTKAGYEMWDGPYGNFGSRKYLLASLDQSLKRLGLDYVDIFYHHRPDPDTPIEESMGALATAVQSGKALYAGLSNYNTRQLKDAMAILRDLKCPFIVNQVRYSIYDRHIEKDGLLDFAHDNGVGLIIYSPLAQGLLSDKYLKGIPKDSRIGRGSAFLRQDQLTEKLLDKIRRLNTLAVSRGQTLSEMALSWVLKAKSVASVLIGASKAGQVVENIKAATHIDFTNEELKEIDEIAD